jgi:hypothetical protein
MEKQTIITPNLTLQELDEIRNLIEVYYKTGNVSAEQLNDDLLQDTIWTKIFDTTELIRNN